MAVQIQTFNSNSQINFNRDHQTNTNMLLNPDHQTSTFLNLDHRTNMLHNPDHQTSTFLNLDHRTNMLLNPDHQTSTFLNLDHRTNMLLNRDLQTNMLRNLDHRTNMLIEECPLTNLYIPSDISYQMEFIKDEKHLKIESMRLETFHCWSIMCPVRPEELARQGFYFTGNDDSVKCIFCHGQLNTWTAGDVVSIEHSKWYPDCPFVQGKHCGNVPMLRTHIKHPPYIMFYDRMESFRGWHTAKNLSPDRMASAGFFQIAPFDHVKCFSCGVRLNKWIPENDPWEEHKKFSPNCPFLLERYNCYLGNEVSSEIVSFENLHIGNESCMIVPQEETQHHLPQQETAEFREDLICPQPQNNDHSLHAFAMLGHESEPSQSNATLQPKAEVSKERFDNLDMLGPEELKQIILEQEDERLCKICFERKLNVIFLPCNHMVCCNECGKQQRLCPICRRNIETINQIYFS